jgi:hypothetical protein
MNWQPIETAPKDRPVFVRAVDLAGFAHALKSGKPSESMLPGITAWTTYHPSAGFTICDIRTTVQWDADAVPPTVNDSLTVQSLNTETNMRTPESCRFAAYYKVQFWNEQQLAWQDVQKQHPSEDAARAAFIAKKKCRVMEVDMKGRRPLP